MIKRYVELTEFYDGTTLKTYGPFDSIDECMPTILKIKKELKLTTPYNRHLYHDDRIIIDIGSHTKFIRIKTSNSQEIYNNFRGATNAK